MIYGFFVTRYPFGDARRRAVSFLAARTVRICVLILVLASSGASAQGQGPAVELTEAERAWLAAHPRIRLAPDPDFKPIEYFDEAGTYQGAAADIIRLLERKLGITITIVRLKNWDEAMAQFKSHDVDLLGAMVRTPNREKFALFTEPLLTVPGGIFARSGSVSELTLDDLKGKKVAVVSNYTAHDVLGTQYPDILLDVAPDVDSALAKTSLGMVDAYVENMANAVYYSQAAGITNLQLVGKTDFDYRWAIGIRKDWPELQGILNKGLAALGEEERSQAIRRWIYIEGQRWRPGKEFYIGFVTLSFAFLLLIAVAWNWSLRKVVRDRTASLRKELTERERVEAALTELTGQLEARVAERTAELQHEVAERKRSEELLRVSEENYRRFAGLTSDYVFIRTRRDGGPCVMSWMGGSGGAITGYSDEEIFKLGCLLPLVHPEDQDALAAHLRGMAPGDSRQSEFRLLTKAGEIKWISENDRCEAGASEGEVVLYGAATDITERKRLDMEIKARLEELVAERTAELEASLSELHLAQARIVASEKLATLGYLASGLAHELNTPLGAIVASNRLIGEHLDEDPWGSVEFLGSLDGGERLLYDRVLAMAKEAGPDLTLTHSAWSRRREGRSEFDSAGIPNGEEVAERLEDLGILGRAGELSGLLGIRRNAEILTFASRAAGARQMAEVVNIAARKAASVVAALSSYLMEKPEDLGQAVDLDGELDKVLILLNNMLKHGIRVRREFSGARAAGSPDKLSQVWLNLIRNAAQAMDFQEIGRAHV